MTLSTDHRDYLLSAAIRPEVIDASGITTRTTDPTGIVFPWNDGSLEEPLPQLRPDAPATDEKGRPVKYRFPAGAKMILNRLRDCGDGPALIVEGTKQQYTALSHAPEDHAVYGLSGCWNWVDADLSWVGGRDVYVLFDGDVTSNPDVHKAATEFAEALDLSGAATVRFVRTTARGNDGLDDVLARLPEEKRAPAMALWIAKALDKLPKAPAKTLANPYFDKQTGFQVLKATNALLEAQPAALTAERKVALYLGGSYHIDGTAFLSAVGRLLGDQFRPAWRGALEEMATGILFEHGKILPERSPFTKLNCANGMLDLRTLELEPHSPDFMSTVQVAVPWEPDARAPIYERWLKMVCPLQIEDLEEVAGTMLDPTRTPHKAAFLFGPSRSGKSTWLRLLQAIAGVENRTAVTLHDLSRDRFAAANVYGKMLNSAADLSSAHVEDLSVFKMMTGEDPIHGNRKYGAQFTFTNQALFAFSANELPTVTESSRAYAERIKPFEFPHSFAGRENPALEQQMLGEELPGILVRWVRAYGRVLERGGYQVTDAAVRKEFDTRSDRVAQWVSDVCIITPADTPGQNLPDHQCTGRRESARAFNQWAERNGGHAMGERKIFDRLGHLPGIYEVRAGRNRQRAFNIVVKDDPNADLPFSTPGAPERAVSGAERAVSEHPSHTTSPSPSNHPREKDLEVRGEGEVYGEGVSKLPALPVTARDLESLPFDLPGDEPVREEPLAPEPASGSSSGPIALGFDLETADADKLFTGGHEGSFVRLAGAAESDDTWQYIGPATPVFLEELSRADVIYGHNVLGFDLLALARHHGADYDKLAAKTVDTLVLARLIDPPLSKGMPNGYYGLDAVAQRLGHEGKTDDLKGLAKRYGGYDKIPLDSREYQDYLRGDLAATKHVYEKFSSDMIGPNWSDLTDYAKREMRVVALQNRMTLNGWAVDRALLTERAEAEDAKRREAIGELHAKYGVPLAKPDRFKVREEWRTYAQGRSYRAVCRYTRLFPEAAVARKLAERIPGEEYASPWATQAGRDALIQAFADAGAVHYPTSARSGQLMTSSDALGDGNWYCPVRRRSFPGMMKAYEGNAGVKAIVDVLNHATGARSKYAEIAPYVTAQGRVHAGVGTAQGSGRWAMTKPSITNMGSRGAAAEERAVLVADEGHLLLTVDASQVDMRAMAALSQDPAYMALFEPGRDAHSEMAVVYFGELNPQTRYRTKAINHKFNYGGGVQSTADMNGIPVDVVQHAADVRAETYPRLVEYIQEVRAAAERGELLDNGFGRLMRPDPERAWTQGPALMGQGCARDICTTSLLRLVEARPDVTPFLRGFVHDELVLSVPADTVEEWAAELERAFTWEWRGVPILCEVGTPAFRWSECK